MAHDSKKKPSLAILARYAAGETEAMKYWKRHIENDRDLLAQVAVLKKLRSMLESIDFTTTIPAARRLAGDIFDNFHARSKGEDAAMARLYFDSAAVPLPEGIRPSRMSERRLKFTTGERDIELSVTPVYPGRFDITGRFLGGKDEFPDDIRLVGRSSLRTDADDFGFFSFSAVSPGTYSLHCQGSGEKLIISDLQLQ
jgi:hypothetical protein